MRDGRHRSRGIWGDNQSGESERRAGRSKAGATLPSAPHAGSMGGGNWVGQGTGGRVELWIKVDHSGVKEEKRTPLFSSDGGSQQVKG